MNFFEQQAAARRRSLWLLLLFAAAIGAMVATIIVWMTLLLGAGPKALGTATVLTLLGIASGSFHRINSLSGGGDAIARQMGGTEVSADSTQPRLRRLHNVTEEVAIASGLPMPRLFVLEEERGINAFAAGHGPGDAAIVVTGGALEMLDRDELQGVIAHEFSHILNGDIRLNIRLVGALFGILMLGLAGRKIFGAVVARRSGARERRYGHIDKRDSEDAVSILLAVTMMSIGYTGLFFGRLIKAGINRSRELLADASAVQFTRQTQGLAGALKKAAALGSGFNQRAQAEEISHMLFSDGAGLDALFATHPPILARIQALEPGFDAQQLKTLRLHWLRQRPNGGDDAPPSRLAADAGPPPLPSRRCRFAVTPEAVSQQVACPDAADYRAAEAISTHLPQTLRDLAHRREGVIPLLLGLMLDPRRLPALRQRQAAAPLLGEAIVQHADALARDELSRLHPMLALPLAGLAFPALRQHPPRTLRALADACDALCHADRRFSPRSYGLAQMLRIQIEEILTPDRRRPHGRMHTLPAVQAEAIALLDILAQLGHQHPEAARRAYQAGIQRLFPQHALPWQPGALSTARLDRLWQPLDQLQPMAKQRLLEAIVATINHDGRINFDEANLLRTICAILHCPLPPGLGTPQSGALSGRPTSE